MKKIFFAIIIITISTLQSCSIFGKLTSTTTIEPQKSFVLGEGKHGAYNARIKNVGKSEIEVFAIAENGLRTSLGILKIREKREYPVSSNTEIQFKNLGALEGVIEILLTGDTRLSMGYKANK